MFQSTPPRGRRPPPLPVLRREKSFNPRLRVGGDFSGSKSCRTSSSVSIHASAWEATPSVQSTVHGWSCFNPRLRVGGDPCLWRLLTAWVCFNPRLRVGGDGTFADRDVETDKFQSTPPRGRRPPAPSRCIRDSPFQSTPPRGRRHAPRPASLARGSFQSTPPRGRRRFAIGNTKHMGESFNPRLRVGGDGVAPLPLAGLPLFQSTPPRGRRQCRGRATGV